MPGSTCAWCRSRGTGRTVGWISCHRNVKFIAHSDGLSSLHPFARDPAAGSPADVWGDVETLEVQFTRKKELELEFAEVRRKKESHLQVG